MTSARIEKMSEKLIRDRLIEKGNVLFQSPKQPIQFTKVAEADKLLDDLTGHPHAFVLACVMDRRFYSEKIWLIPNRISQEFHGFSMEVLLSLSQEKVSQLIRQPPALHCFADKMSVVFCSAVNRIENQYKGKADLIWDGKPSSAEVVYRFLEFDGVGPKIACMAANTLARDFKIPFDDYFSIDISADVHVRRVFARLGLCAANSTVEQVIYKARSLNPDFPGIIDLPCWEIGENWCKPGEKPKCDQCYMKDLCPTANSKI